jgi:putative molybdopterin biosynthesis protein
MGRLQTIKQLDQIALLGDRHRLAIVRRLMAAPATLSQLAQALNSYPAHIRHHLKKLEEAGLLLPDRSEIVGGVVHKYYRAAAQAYLIQTAVTPQLTEKTAVIAMGSHDPALEALSQQFCATQKTPDLFSFPVGSLDGLIALRQGICHLAGAHLADEDGLEFNLTHTRHLFPGQAMSLLTLAYRQQGLVTAANNPKQIRSLADLARPDIRFINRQRGAGTRLWLERQLHQLGLDVNQIEGFNRAVESHNQVARAVASGQADVGLAVLAAAQAHQLHFIPLFAERYDLILPTAVLDEPLLQPLLDSLQTAAFRHTLSHLGGYDSSATGSRRDLAA